MNVKPMIDAVESLNAAIEATFDPKERRELTTINHMLRMQLRKRGVFVWQPDSAELREVVEQYEQRERKEQDAIDDARAHDRY